VLAPADEQHVADFQIVELDLLFWVHFHTCVCASTSNSLCRRRVCFAQLLLGHSANLPSASSEFFQPLAKPIMIGEHAVLVLAGGEPVKLHLFVLG
jgi:hypothetical protein